GVLLQVEEGHARAVARKGAHEGFANAAGAAADQHDLVLEAHVPGEAHAMRRSVCGSNRQAVRVSTEKVASWPSASLVSGATRARSRSLPTRSSTRVSAPVGSLISTSASRRTPPARSLMHSGRMPR